MTASVETLVVGAGISGLAYAHARGPDAELVVLDASERAGGLMRTARDGDYRFELGPEALRSGPGALADLLAELGIEAHPPAESKRFVVHRGGLVEVPLAPQKLLSSRLLSFAGKLRLMSEPTRAADVALDGSVAEFVRHRIGQEALDVLIDPLVSGIHAGDPAQLSMRACFPRLVELVERHGSLFKALQSTRGSPAPGVVKPRGGIGSIPEALAARLGPKLRLARAVTAISRGDAGWRVQASGESFAARKLVLALPSASAARLLSGPLPELARAIQSMAAESLVSVTHVHRREDVAHPLDGFGYLASSRERLHHLGTLFSSRIDPECCPRDRVLLRTLIGGARLPEAVDWDEPRILEVIEREVGALLGIRTRPLWTHVQRWRSTLPRFDLAHPGRVVALERATPPDLVLLGNWLRGIGVHHLVESAHAAAVGA